MFLHVSVSHSVHTGRGVSQPALQVISQHALQVSRVGVCVCIPACLTGFQTHTQGFRGLAKGGLQAHTWGWVSRPTPRVVSKPTPRGVSQPTPRGCIPGCTEADPPTDGYCCGRYASYWNAFLFIISFIVRKEPPGAHINVTSQLEAKMSLLFTWKL